MIRAILDTIADALDGNRTWCVVDAGDGAFFVLTEGAAATYAPDQVIQRGMGYRAACRLSDKRRQAWRDTPRPIL